MLKIDCLISKLACSAYLKEESMKTCFLLLNLLFLGACTSMPQVIRDFPATDIPYQQISQDADAYKDVPVRWGGTVIDVENEADSSLVQVLFYPLDRSGYPQINKPGEGRFAIETDEFLDPAIFIEDTEITITGIIKGNIERTVGNKTIRVPLVSAAAVYLWPKDFRRSRYYGNERFFYPPYPYFGYYGHPFFYRGFFSPYGYWW